VPQGRKGLQHDAVAFAVIKKVRLLEIWMRLDLKHGRLYPGGIGNLLQDCQTDV
jgi:hypothetical protein